MLHVLTHKPSPNLQKCELTFVKSEKIDMQKAQEQHKSYCQVLTSCGAMVDTIDDNILLADSVFVEDPILVFDEIAILTSMGVASRRKESAALEAYFSEIKPLVKITLPAKIEGGDVLVIEKKVYVGLSTRTNQEAIDQLHEILKPFGYEVISVKVTGCLHLKTGCTALDANTLILNPHWLDTSKFDHFKIIQTPEDEPFGANVMPINNSICMNASFPKTIELIKAKGYDVKPVDISEFVKAEAGLTCMSVRYKEND